MVRQSRRRRRAHPSVSSGRDYFNACWLAEWLRLRETHWGPMEDAAEVRRARIEGQTFTQQILMRASFLCRRENLDAIQEHWMHGARLVLMALGVLAIVAGAGSALGALGNAAAPVNIALALTAILGLQCMNYPLWLADFPVPSAEIGRREWEERVLLKG